MAEDGENIVRLIRDARPPSGGGGSGLERRVERLELEVATLADVIVRLEKRSERFEEVMMGQMGKLDGSFADLRRDFADLRRDVPTQWDMAKIVVYLVVAFAAVAMVGPRLVALLGA